MVELILQIVTKAANRQQMAVSLDNPVFITAIIVVRLGLDVGEFFFTERRIHNQKIHF